MTNPTPLLVLGLDAAGPEILNQGLAAGRLPHLRRLLRSGLRATPAGPEFLSEHGVWVSLTSGIPRRQHGYYWFRQLAPGTYDVRPFSARNLDAKPFWHLFAGTSRPVAIFDVPDTDPLPGLSGVQLTNWAVHDPHSEPAALPPSALDHFGPPQPIHENCHSNLAQDRLLFSQLASRLTRKGELCRQLITQTQPHLTFLVFGETHTGSHQFWRYRHSSGELSTAILDLYAAADHQLGLLLDSYSTPPNVAILGSVGLRSEWPSEGFLADFCLKLGYSAAHPPSVSPLDIARRILPQSLRNSLSKLLPQSTQSNLLSQKFATSLDWPRTRIFALPYFYMGLLRVNLKGREPQGTVSPGHEYHHLLDQISADLLALRDPADNLPAVAQIHRSTSLFGAEPHPHLPDLFVEWRPSPQTRLRLLHPRATILQDTPVFNRGSEHIQQGFLALSGPDIANLGDLGVIDPLTIAPTLAQLCGLPTDSFPAQLLNLR